LPWECLFEVKEGIIESRVRRMNSAKVVVELQALRECIQERDMLAAVMAAEAETSGNQLGNRQTEEDLTVFESRVIRLRTTYARDTSWTHGLGV
jgi:hypothetical protein